MRRTLAPIALFVYNRPEHTRRTLEALSQNGLAAESRLIIFADGPKSNANDQERQRVSAVRDLLRQKSWCGEIEIVESDTNKGLAHSIEEGVGSVLAEQDRIIVLEDDIVTSSGFLCFMNQALDLYENEPKVFQVTGFMVPNKAWARQTGFLRIISSWGWATWKRAWEHYRNDADFLLKAVRQKGESAFDLDDCAHQLNDLQRNANGALNTWAVKWYASVFLEDGLCLYPRKSMLVNIGLDGSGTNCGEFSAYRTRATRLVSKTVVKRIPIHEDPTYLAAMKRHYLRLRRKWTTKPISVRVTQRFETWVNRIFHSQ